MDTPQVTVVTVVRNLREANRMEMFRQCVESVRGQSWPSVEHLVVDGASTDGTQDTLDEYAQQGVLTYHSAPDGGIYDAMNTGLLRAEGQYVTFLNSDDFYHDSRFLEQSLLALSRSGADCSYAPVRVLTSDGRQLVHRPHLGAALIYMPFCHQTVLYKAVTLRRFPFHPGFPIAADYEQILRLLLDGCRFHEVPLCGVSFRYGGSSSLDATRSNADFTKVHSSVYPAWGLSLKHCSHLLKKHILPQPVFQALLTAVAPEHRHLFVEWRRRDARRRLKHWFLTWKRREGRRSIRILGIWLVQDS